MEKFIQDKNVLNLYLNGSRVYKTASADSDYDYIMVVTDEAYKDDSIKGENFDINVYSKSQWIEMARENNLNFCECYFLPREFKLKETFIPEFKIDIPKLRASFSHVSSNSFVKCKKKLTVEKDYAPYIGKKSLWHSFRILMFGIQILSTGKIYDYTQANSLYNEIVKNPCNDWSYYKEKYQALYNHYRSEFRKFDKQIQSSH